MGLFKKNQTDFWLQKGKAILGAKADEESIVDLSESIEIASAVTDPDLREAEMKNNFEDWLRNQP